MSFQIKKATKQRIKLKLAVQGPAGSGKTKGALALAFTLSPNKKVCVIDTENGSASLYADHFDEFAVIDLGAPFTSARYQEAIDAAVAAEFEAIVIDSITHQWDGEGGILDRKAELDKRPGSNSYTNWQSFTPEHTRFLQHILQAPIHVIATMRSKSEYVLETNQKGKQQPRKVGMSPIQRDGVEFEFTVVFDVQLDHKAQAIKDRTGLFDEKVIDLCKPSVGKQLIDWMSTGVEPAVVHLQKPSIVKDGSVELRKASDTLKGVVNDVTTNGKGLWIKVGDTKLHVRDEVREKLEASIGQKVELLVSRVEGQTFLAVHNVVGIGDAVELEPLAEAVNG